MCYQDSWVQIHSPEALFVSPRRHGRIAQGRSCHDDHDPAAPLLRGFGDIPLSRTARVAHFPVLSVAAASMVRDRGLPIWWRTVRSPKLDVVGSRRRHYQYYAGYSDGFVEDALSRMGVTGDELILDPWNGSGTTTSTAAANGLRAVGFDINPAAVLIGRSGLLQSDVADSLRPLTVEICKLATEQKLKPRPDPLGNWFGPRTSL